MFIYKFRLNIIKQPFLSKYAIMYDMEVYNMDGKFSLEFKKCDNKTIISVSGGICVKNSTDLKNMVIDNEELSDFIILNMSNVDFLDSIGIAALINLNKELLKIGKKFVIITDTPQILRVIKITQLNKIIHILSDMEKLDRLMNSGFEFNRNQIGKYPSEV